MDLKTCQSINKVFFHHDIGYMNFLAEWGYYIQGAVYQKVVEINTGKKLPFFIAAVSKEKVPDIQVIAVEQNLLDEALAEVEHNVPMILALKNKAADPTRCECCDYCKQTRVLSLLSTMFGYGTKKYSFENGQIKTATEYAGERQDAMQELNKQRAEAESYIRDICKAILWFSNTFQGTNWNVDEEITVSFDDSYVTDRQSEMESKRADALSFREIPKLTIWYLMDRYNLSEDEAVKLYNEGNLEDTDDETED